MKNRRRFSFIRVLIETVKKSLCIRILVKAPNLEIQIDMNCLHDYTSNSYLIMNFRSIFSSSHTSPFWEKETD